MPVYKGTSLVDALRLGTSLVSNWFLGTVGGGSSLPLRAADTNSYAPDGVISPAGSATRLSYLSRFKIIIGDDKSDLRLSFTTKKQNADNTVSSINANYVIDEITVEAPNGNTQRVTFGGSNGRTMVVGEDDIQCDPIAPLAGYTQFTEGEEYWFKVAHSHPNSTAEAPNHGLTQDTTGITGAQVFRYNRSAVTYSDFMTAGPITITSGTDYNATTRGLRPMVVGRTINDMPTWFLTGDSISNYANDVANSEGPPGSGYLNRALYNGKVRPVAALSFARSSTGTKLLVNNTFWENYIKYCSHAIEAYGVNNFNSNDTFATLQADKATIRAKLNTGGIANNKITMVDFFPYVTNTPVADLYLTTANQTVKVQGANTFSTYYQDPLDALAASLLASGGIRHYLKHLAARAATSGPDFYKWVVDGVTNNYGTIDGLHPSPLVHTNSKPEARRIFEFEYFEKKLELLKASGALLGWFDPDYPTTITQSGGTVSNIACKAVTNNAVQASSPAQAAFTSNAFKLYRNGLTFNPADNEQYTLDTAIPDADGVIAVFAIKPTNNGTNRFILGSNALTNGAQVSINTANLLVVSKFSGATLLISASTVTAGNTYYIEIKYGASGIQIYINGVLDATTATVPTFAQGYKTIGGRGGNACFSGVIGRVIFAKATISGADETMINNAVKFMTDI